MNHAHILVALTPRVNFITGINGGPSSPHGPCPCPEPASSPPSPLRPPARSTAGKSAVLTGLVVCLGGKAQNTDRGSSLKDFIKDGAR